MAAEEVKGINAGATGRPAGSPNLTRGLDTDKLKEGMDGARRLAGAIDKYRTGGRGPAGDSDSDLDGTGTGEAGVGEVPDDLAPRGVIA
jgi:hypothetical protein